MAVEAGVIDAREFRNTLGLFASGVAVIVGRSGDSVQAMTANAVSSLSLDPPLVLFCPAKKSRMAQNLDGIEGFTINFLREEQQALSSYFAGGWKHEQPPPHRLVDAPGAPRLEGALASLCCAKHAVHDGGDHLVVVGRVLALHQGIPPRVPLVFFAGSYRELANIGAPAPDLNTVEDEPPHVFYAD